MRRLLSLPGVCPSGQRERAVNPSAQPTEVRILPPPLPQARCEASRSASRLFGRLEPIPLGLGGCEPPPDQAAGELEEGAVVLGLLRPPDQQAAEAVQPGVGAL